MVVLALVLAVAGFVQGYLLGVIGERIVARLRSQLYARLVTLPLEFHVRRRVGELISRLSSDVTQVRTMLTQTLTSLLSSLVSLVGAIIILLLASPTLLVLVLVMAPALIVVAVIVGRPLQRLSTQVQDALATSTTTAEEALGGIRVVKSFVREDWELRRYDTDLRGVVGMATRLIAWRGMFGAAMTFLGFAALVVILWYTGRQVIDGALTLGALTAFLLYGVTIGSSLGTLASLYGQFREGTGAVQRVFELLDEQPTILDPEHPRPLGPVDGRITFEAVSFGYAPDRAVLRSIDLDIAPGEVLALVGPSGAGKTTVCNLIPRLWDVTSGRILVDDVDIRTVATRELREAIGLVPQEATLFGGSIRDNIAYGRLDASDARDRGGRACRERPRFHLAAAPGVRDHGRRPGHAPVGRSATARGDRSRHPQGPADPAPGRGHQLARQRVRTTGAGGARAADGVAHDDRRGAPAVDHQTGRPDRGPGRRLADRARHARGAAGARWPVRPTLPAPVERGCRGPGRRSIRQLMPARTFDGIGRAGPARAGSTGRGGGSRLPRSMVCQVFVSPPSGW